MSKRTIQMLSSCKTVSNAKTTKKAKLSNKIAIMDEKVHLWLNDEIINRYMDLIVKRSPETIYAFNTFFYLSLSVNGYEKVSRWTKNVDIFSKKKILIPIHIEEDNHWCLCCVDFENKSITYYDSLGSRNFKCLKLILQYLVYEYYDKKKIEFRPGGWRLTNTLQYCPQQGNLWDCGVFVCTFAEYLARDEEFDFSQKDMPKIRKQMKFELRNKKLINDMPKA